jgi:hypothetical protein
MKAPTTLKLPGGIEWGKTIALYISLTPGKRHLPAALFQGTNKQFKEK